MVFSIAMIDRLTSLEFSKVKTGEGSDQSRSREATLTLGKLSTAGGSITPA